MDPLSSYTWSEMGPFEMVLYIGNWGYNPSKWSEIGSLLITYNWGPFL